MRKIPLSLLYAVGLLSVTMLTSPNAEAANIPPSITVPPPAAQAMNFTAPESGATLTILANSTFSGAITNGGANVGTLILNSGSQLNGAVATGISPLLQVTLNGSATIIGATSATTFNLGQNILTNTGALNLPSGLTLNTRVVSDAVFGRINASAM